MTIEELDIGELTYWFGRVVLKKDLEIKKNSIFYKNTENLFHIDNGLLWDLIEKENIEISRSFMLNRVVAAKTIFEFGNLTKKVCTGGSLGKTAKEAVMKCLIKIKLGKDEVPN